MMIEDAGMNPVPVNLEIHPGTNDRANDNDTQRVSIHKDRVHSNDRGSISGLVIDPESWRWSEHGSQDGGKHSTVE